MNIENILTCIRVLRACPFDAFSWNMASAIMSDSPEGIDDGWGEDQHLSDDGEIYTSPYFEGRCWTGALQLYLGMKEDQFYILVGAKHSVNLEGLPTVRFDPEEIVEKSTMIRSLAAAAVNNFKYVQNEIVDVLSLINKGG